MFKFHPANRWHWLECVTGAPNRAVTPPGRAEQAVMLVSSFNCFLAEFCLQKISLLIWNTEILTIKLIWKPNWFPQCTPQPLWPNGGYCEVRTAQGDKIWQKIARCPACYNIHHNCYLSIFIIIILGLLQCCEYLHNN